ncbi:hypothetical protein DM860_011453 [Cuscuta australis]|uniref:Gamma-tubulin complex component n=1 Tax=Cuscuta australis TaxID=267555 RepID=A0A328DTN3_9ASTE|nr:hypothetical protein DM860_011453 [Cuscuta australis]
MDEGKLSSGSNDHIDDIRWLCSLNESELDFLMSLKGMILQRAKSIGSKPMAKNFGLKFLRALSFILMNKLKGQLEGVPGYAGSPSSHLDRCKLLKFDLDDTSQSLSMEELSTYICSEKNKRALSAFFKDVLPPPPSKKPKTEG